MLRYAYMRIETLFLDVLARTSATCRFAGRGDNLGVSVSGRLEDQVAVSGHISQHPARRSARPCQWAGGAASTGGSLRPFSSTQTGTSQPSSSGTSQSNETCASGTSSATECWICASNRNASHDRPPRPHLHRASVARPLLRAAHTQITLNNPRPQRTARRRHRPQGPRPAHLRRRLRHPAARRPPLRQHLDRQHQSHSRPAPTRPRSLVRDEAGRRALTNETACGVQI